MEGSEVDLGEHQEVGVEEGVGVSFFYEPSNVQRWIQNSLEVSTPSQD